jgi:nucleoside-diphosphate-sugar epimerase
MKGTVLIAGGAGFLGSHLCDSYIKTHEVICVDNLSTGSMRNIAHLEGEKSFQFIEADIVGALPDSVMAKKYAIVINMASPASPPHYQRLAVETLEAGSIGTKNLLELAKRDNARFFQASTSEVYGDPEVHPQTELYKGSVNCYGPRSMYDEAKRYAEALIYVYKNTYKVNTVVARFFNTYGPRMDKDDGRVVSNFINQAIDGRDLTIYGDGSQTRSFCYVDDLIKAILLLIDSSEEGPINLGNPSEFTIKELATIVQEMIPGKSKIVYEPLPGDDPLQRKPDITKVKQVLGWEPTVKLRDGLRETMRYFQGA